MSAIAEITPTEPEVQPASKAAQPRRAVYPTPEDRAEAHERRVKAEMDAQFRRLKDEAHALYGMVEGRPGIRSRGEWEKLLAAADDDIGTGRFVVR